MKSFWFVPKSALLVPLTLVLFATSGAALAVNSSHVQITVNGTVSNSSCIIVGGPSQTVNLGVASPAILNSSNPDWVWKAFEISLEHCPIGMSKATITFNGEPDPTNPLYYKNTAAASQGVSVAENVAIEVTRDPEGDDLSTGKQMVTLVNSTTHKAAFKMRARMISPVGRATAGNVAGHIDYTIEYQ